MPSEYSARFVIAQQRQGEQLRRQDLHGMIGALIGHGEQKPPLWSLGRWRLEGPLLTLRVRFRDDELPKALDNGLARVAGPLEAGRRNAMAPVAWAEPDPGMRYLHLERQETWQELAAASPIAKCAIEVTTPLNFAKKSAEFDMFKVLTSLHRQWTDIETRPDFSPIQRNSFVVAFERAMPYTEIVEGAELFGVCGWWALAARDPEEPRLAQSVGALLSLAPYCGVGYATAYGLGQICIHPLNAMMSPRLAPKPFIEGGIQRRSDPKSESGHHHPPVKPSARRPAPTMAPRKPADDASRTEATAQPVITRTNPTG
ncbi:MAG: CRISPR system precrRNA processing endoribonuclease RAMP protein Cas6 [Acidipropionibacterium sp.]|nr:CRISPR system precrRNA processing endoribonuclease RAMP protein Cas6 [Acidipropionibacterium sp.]